MHRKPCAVINKHIIQANIKRMVNKYNNKIEFRPHFKTHQSLEIGKMFRKYTDAITVSSCSMAKYFSRDWKRMTLAVPCNPLEISQLNEFDDDVDIELVVDNMTIIQLLNASLRRKHRIWIKIDSGYGRAGVHYTNIDEVVRLSREINDKSSSKLEFMGLLSHQGNTYDCNNINDIKKVFSQGLHRLNTVRERVSMELNRDDVGISVGDTPSSSVCEPDASVQQIRPGNFVFYDVDQYLRGVCALKDIGLAITAPILSLYPERRECLIYCGAVHLSKDYAQLHGNRNIYGAIGFISNDNHGWDVIPLEKAWLSSVSQEVGIIKVEDANVWSQLAVGQLIYILPFHSCLAADQYTEYYDVHSGEKIERFSYR